MTNHTNLIERLNALEDYARAASRELMHHAGGGSEMFKTVVGQPYADPALCRANIMRRNDTMRAIFDTRISTLTAEVEGLRAALAAFVNRFQLYAGDDGQYGGETDKKLIALGLATLTKGEGDKS